MRYFDFVLGALSENVRCSSEPVVVCPNTVGVNCISGSQSVRGG